VLLASSVALLPVFGSDAVAYQFDEPDVKAIGPEQVVYDYSTMKCSSEDIPDSPARAFRDSQNRVQLIASHASVRRKIGPDLNSVQHQCPIVMDSHGSSDPSAFDDREWLSSIYTLDGQTIYGLMSVEYHGWEYDENCAGYVAAGQHLKCWYNSINLTKSVNAGATYSHTTPPTHLVASAPYQYAAGNGPLGYFDPSNIVYRQSDGYYYAMIRAEANGAQQWGACLMRTQNLNDPTSWRAWDGTGFGVSFMNPYIGTDPPAQHVCQPVSPASFPVAIQTASLTYSTYLNKYVLLGVSQRFDSAAQRWNGGFFYSLSTDLIHWSPSKYFMHAQLPWTHRCGEPDPVRDPSLIDPTSTSRNFETIGRRPYLYFTRFNMEYWDPKTCWATLDRDLIRIPVEFTDTSPNQPPTASFTVNPNPAQTGQTVTFNGSASGDADGTIASYSWDLDGNGTFETNTGMNASVTRSYASTGTVTVRLRVTDNDGGTAETTRTLTVTNRAPAASFTASPNPAIAGDVVSFSASASSDPDGTIVDYRWDLDGNGTFETDTGTNASVTRSYASTGTVTVQLRVTDNDGGTAETTRDLTVDPPPPVNELPSALFVVSPNPAQSSEIVTFNGNKSKDPDGTIANFTWDLDGNGSFETDTGTTSMVTRSYASAGTVDVRLRVTDNDGASSDTTRRLTVSTPPAPSPPPAPVPGPPGPLGPPAASAAPAASCVTAHTRRTRLTRKLRSARRKLARARTARARKKYRRLIRKLTRQRKRIRLTSCAR
jgi:PKD repeat protein